MIKIKKEGIILAPTKLPFESKCVFNPAIYQDGKNIHVIYRALDDKFMSCFGYARLDGPLKVAERWKKPFMEKKFSYESKGIEDPRIVKIDDTFYMTYVAHNGVDAVIAYVAGDTLFDLKRCGIISPKISYKRAGKLFRYTKLKDEYLMFAGFYENYCAKNVLVWEKDGVLFPEKFHDQFVMLHRILPDIQAAYFKDFADLKDENYWHNHIQHLAKHVVLEGRQGFEARHIGAGAPPIKTKKGWLLIYHAVEPKNKGRIYRAGAALLNLHHPQRVIARLPYPLFSPEEKWEHQGHVHNVVFPTGTAEFGKKLYIYYGSADTYVACASVDKDKLIDELLKYKVKS
ncbi:MAG: pesticidal protein Cry7Aa [bacterium]